MRGIFPVSRLFSFPNSKFYGYWKMDKAFYFIKFYILILQVFFSSTKSWCTSPLKSCGNFYQWNCCLLSLSGFYTLNTSNDKLVCWRSWEINSACLPGEVSAPSVGQAGTSLLALWASERQHRHAGGSCAGIFKQSLGARNRVGIGLSYRPARLHRLAELIPWNRS